MSIVQGGTSYRDLYDWSGGYNPVIHGRDTVEYPDNEQDKQQKAAASGGSVIGYLLAKMDQDVSSGAEVTSAGDGDGIEDNASKGDSRRSFLEFFGLKGALSDQPQILVAGAALGAVALGFYLWKR